MGQTFCCRIVSRAGSTIGSQQKCLRFKCWLRPFCVELACLSCMHGFPLGAPVSSHSPKTWLSRPLMSMNWSYVWLWRVVSLSVNPVIGLPPIQGVPLLSPLDGLDRLQQTPATPVWIKHRKLVDVFVIVGLYQKIHSHLVNLVNLYCLKLEKKSAQ